jgi:hypothetical protein
MNVLDSNPWSSFLDEIIAKKVKNASIGGLEPPSTP